MNVDHIDNIEKLEVEFQKGDFIGYFSNELIIQLLKTIDPFEEKAYMYPPNDATVVGLFTKIYKHFDLLLKAHNRSENETVFMLCRPIYEAFVIFKYLILHGEDSQKHYRLISYRRRYEILKELEESKEYGEYGKVIVYKIKSAIEEDGFSIKDFEEESSKKGKGKKWQLDGKTFADIHKEVECSGTYTYIYGLFSDIIHSGWGDIRQLHLLHYERNYYTPKLDINNYDDTRIINPIISILLESVTIFLEWSKREDELNVYDDFKRVNNLISNYIMNKYETNPDNYLYN